MLATFIVPAALALLLGRVLPLNLAEMAGLFLVGAAPGAPLMTRNIAKRGFDMQLAAGYQVWGGLLTPLILPFVVYGAGLLYGRNIWIPPQDVLLQIVEKQFVPLLVGMTLAYFLPVFSGKAQVWMNRAGNAVLTLGILAMLWFMRETLKGLLTWWLPLGAVLLAVGICGGDPVAGSHGRSGVAPQRWKSAMPTGTLDWRCCSADSICKPRARCRPSQRTL